MELALRISMTILFRRVQKVMKSVLSLLFSPSTRSDYIDNRMINPPSVEGPSLLVNLLQI